MLFCFVQLRIATVSVSSKLEQTGGAVGGGGVPFQVVMMPKLFNLQAIAVSGVCVSRFLNVKRPRHVLLYTSTQQENRWR